MYDDEQEQKRRLYAYHEGREYAFLEMAQYFRHESGLAYTNENDKLALECRRFRLKMIDLANEENKHKIIYEDKFSGGV